MFCYECHKSIKPNCAPTGLCQALPWPLTMRFSDDFLSSPSSFFSSFFLGPAIFPFLVMRSLFLPRSPLFARESQVSGKSVVEAGADFHGGGGSAGRSSTSHRITAPEGGSLHTGGRRRQSTAPAELTPAALMRHVLQTPVACLADRPRMWVKVVYFGTWKGPSLSLFLTPFPPFGTCEYGRKRGSDQLPVRRSAPAFSFSRILTQNLEGREPDTASEASLRRKAPTAPGGGRAKDLQEQASPSHVAWRASVRSQVARESSLRRVSGN